METRTNSPASSHASGDHVSEAERPLLGALLGSLESEYIFINAGQDQEGPVVNSPASSHTLVGDDQEQEQPLLGSADSSYALVGDDQVQEGPLMNPPASPHELIEGDQDQEEPREPVSQNERPKHHDAIATHINNKFKDPAQYLPDEDDMPIRKSLHEDLDLGEYDPKSFHGEVVMSSNYRGYAARYASRVCAEGISENRIILWAKSAYDPQIPREMLGYAVVHREQSRWIRKLGRSSEDSQTLAELLAIKAALGIAVEEATRRLEKDSTYAGRGPLIRVFSDCKSALRLTSEFPRLQENNDRLAEILEAIVQESREIHRIGSRLVLHWVPRGDVEGYVVAHVAAKASHKGDTALREGLAQSRAYALGHRRALRREKAAQRRNGLLYVKIPTNGYPSLLANAVFSASTTELEAQKTDQDPPAETCQTADVQISQGALEYDLTCAA